MSAMSAGLRAVTAACHPRARTASASSRPKPVEQPVISHVCIIFPRLGFRDERAWRPESAPAGLFPAPMHPAFTVQDIEMRTQTPNTCRKGERKASYDCVIRRRHGRSRAGAIAFAGRGL